MSKAPVVLSGPEYQFSDEKISPIPVLLIDSDGTIFYGNMKKIISAVISFLKKAPEERNNVDEFFKKSGTHDLPEETMEFLKLWLKKQEDFQIPWEIPDEELYQIQQIIAESFPLIKSGSTALTALDVFKMVKEKNGVVMILTFNIFAPFTIRQALVKKGLSIEEASKIKIIYPVSGMTPCPEDGMYTCPLPQGDRTLNKNAFIKEAQRICHEEFKLIHCEYIFADDQHARAAQLKCSDIRVVTGEYASGQHLEILKNYLKDDADHESKQCNQVLDNSSRYEAPVFDIAGEGCTPELKSLNSSTGGRRLSKTNDSAQAGENSTRKMSFELLPLSLPPVLPQNISPMGTKKFGQRMNFFPAETMSDSNSDENLGQKIHEHTSTDSNTSRNPLIVSSSMDSIEKSTSPESPISEQSSNPFIHDFSRNQLSQISPKAGGENQGFPKSNSMTTFPLIREQSPPKRQPALNSSEAQNTEPHCCCLIL